MDFSSPNLPVSNCWILVCAQLIFFYNWVEASTFNMQFIPPLFGWDDHKEMILATLGCSNVKVSQMKGYSESPTYLSVARENHNKYSFHY